MVIHYFNENYIWNILSGLCLLGLQFYLIVGTFFMLLRYGVFSWCNFLKTIAAVCQYIRAKKSH